jgi:hypothetical protein
VSDESRTGIDYARRHLRFGWWSLLVFLSFGLVLESLHGFKVRAYLDVSNETRRLMWTLAHAHGTLLSVVHVIFGLSARAVPELSPRSQRPISTCLMGASVLLPGGFFLAGITFYSGDPGLGVLLVPLGAALLMLAVFLLARASGSVGLPEGLGPSRVERSRRETRHRGNAGSAKATST